MKEELFALVLTMAPVALNAGVVPLPNSPGATPERTPDQDRGPGLSACLHTVGRSIGHGCSALTDRALLRRLARDRILVECCLTSNYQTGAASRGAPHPIFTFLDHGIPVAVCTDNTTVSATNQTVENELLLGRLTLAELEAIHRTAAEHSFIRRVPMFQERAAKASVERRAARS